MQIEEAQRAIAMRCSSGKGGLFLVDGLALLRDKSNMLNRRISAYHPGNGGFPGDELGTNGAQVLLQSPPFCPHLLALSSSRQSSSVALPHTFVRKKLITTAAVEPPLPRLVA